MFKKGEVYKATKTLGKLDGDCNNWDNLFEKDYPYQCKKDGTLYSFGTFDDEEVPDEYQDSFVLIGHCVVRKDIGEIRKEAMQWAFESTNDSNSFDDFYLEYSKKFHEIKKEQEEKSKNGTFSRFTRLDGTVDCFYNKFGNPKKCEI